MAETDRTEETRREMALITGASSGIGEAFADRLAGEGFDLILVARRRERLEALARRLEERDGVAVDVLTADLTVPDERRGVEERLAADGSLAMLVNNAGFAGYMPFVELPADTAESLIELQVVAAVRLARAALPGMIARRQGVIINVASLLAFSAGIPPVAPLPRRATYAASKAFLVTFSELLAGELAGTGVQVQALCPGVVEPTEFHVEAGLHPAQLSGAMTPPEVVQASLVGLELGEVVVMPPIEDPAALTVGRDAQGHSTYPHGGLAARGPLARRYR